MSQAPKDLPTIGTTVDKLSELTKKEKSVLNEYLQEDHMAVIPHDHADTEIKSKGEKTFDWVTYKGIGWLTNAAISIYLTDWLMHGKGVPLLEKGVKKLAPFYEKLGMSSEISAARAKSTFFTGGLFTGGTLLLYPVKKLEDYKPQLVKYLDDHYNQSSTPDQSTLAIQQAAHKRLDTDPKPSWGNVLLGRLLGMGVVTAFTVGIGRGRDIELSKKFAAKTTKALSESGNGFLKTMGESKRAENMLGISFMEIYTSFIAEEVLYYTTQAYKNLKRKDMLEAAKNDNEITKPEERSTNTWADHMPQPSRHADKVIEMKDAASLGLGA